MSKPVPRILSVFFVAMSLSALFGAAFDPSDIKKDPNYFYGFGTAKTAQEAQQNALNDLISDALTQTATAKTEAASRIVITSDIAPAFKMSGLQPFINQKDNDIYAFGYRILRADWIKLEAPREAALRSDFVAQFKAISGDTGTALQDRIVAAGVLLARISTAGVYDVLTETDTGTVLLSAQVESFCRTLVAGLKIAVTPESGLVHSGTVFAATVTLGTGAPLPAFPLGFVWRSAKKTAPGGSLISDAAGKGVVAFPADDAFKNREIWLKIGTTFSATVPASRFLVALDAANTREYQYRQLEAASSIGANEVAIAAGSFQAGMLSHDRRAAASTEKPRTVKLKAFAIDKYPVTNALYGAYLDDAKIPESDYPDYWDNPDYNQPDQPVIGVSWDDANKFAAWLSARVGYTKRLPSEDEYERAARGGKPFIYPWGDQAATDTIRANYNGNTRFDATSPVGSFETGKNPLGLYDMSGNVWEWTSSSPDKNMNDDPSWKIVKGGSWMDGPAELRVSNRRALDPAQRYQDTGFRLVREVTP